MEFFKSSRKLSFNDFELYICGYIFGLSDQDLMANYIKDGAKTVETVDGSFAFAILDKRSNSLFITTDFYGTKVIYYTFENGFDFGVDPKQLNSKKEIDRDSIELYLRFGTIPLEFSPYKNIKKLLPNSYITVDLNSFKFTVKSHKKLATDIENISFSEASDLIENSLANLVENIPNLANCGLFLSGGIDSGLLAYYASKKINNIKTFTISFDDSYDESNDAEKVAKIVGTHHKSIVIAPDLKDSVEKILTISNEPFFDSSLIPSYYASKEAKNYTDSVIIGDGADEIFAGYRRYVPIVNGWYKIAKNFGFLLPLLPMPKDKKTIYNWFYRLVNSASSKTDIEFWLKSRVDLIGLNSNKLFDSIDKNLKNLEVSPLTNELLNDHKLLLFSDLTPKMQMATRSNNLTAYTPFMTKDIYKIAFSIDNNYKINGTKTKYILRELYSKNIDKELAYRPKRGFEVPLKKWVDTTLKEIINDHILSPNAYWKNYLPDTVLDDLDSERRAKIVWMLFCLEVWYKNR